MQVRGLAEIQLAEDFSSVRVPEWVPETWKYMTFTQFWSSPQILNKFLSGEFCVFRGKWSLFGQVCGSRCYLNE